ncbi:MAG: 2-phosphosulfolactate phosphatase, partial [Flavisolibacter sp.]
EGKTLVLTTTNGTKLLHMALAKGATEIITGSFLNLTAVCEHLASINKNVILGCAAWKDKPNMEDTMFAGAVVSAIKDHFTINCDSSRIAETLYQSARKDLFGFMKKHEASHYHRLINFGLEKDIRHCLTPDLANVLPEYEGGKLVAQKKS